MFYEMTCACNNGKDGVVEKIFYGKGVCKDVDSITIETPYGERKLWVTRIKNIKEYSEKVISHEQIIVMKNKLGNTYTIKEHMLKENKKGYNFQTVHGRDFYQKKEYIENIDKYGLLYEYNGRELIEFFKGLK